MCDFKLTLSSICLLFHPSFCFSFLQELQRKMPWSNSSPYSNEDYLLFSNTSLTILGLRVQELGKTYLVQLFLNILNTFKMAMKEKEPMLRAAVKASMGWSIIKLATTSFILIAIYKNVGKLMKRIEKLCLSPLSDPY